MKITLKTLSLLICVIAIVNGADFPTNDSVDNRIAEAQAFSKEFFFKEARIKYITMSRDSDLPWNLRLQALDELSQFNEIAAVQEYLRLHELRLPLSTTMRIEIQLTRLMPDLTRYHQIVRDQNSKPLEHFNAAYCLQDWLLPEHAVYPFELLLEKIKKMPTRYIPMSSHPDELEFCQRLSESLRINAEKLLKLYNAATVIISELESQFTK